jgi:hypothetical protein
MWNSLKAIWRTLNTLFWIVSTLVILYFLYTISDGRFRFLFWQANPAVKGNVLEQPEPVEPRNERRGGE